MDTTLSAPIGQLLDGRYLVESQLARGGMAAVYLSRDVRLDRTVALKIAHPDLARDSEFVARFIGEARAVARLSSPNVVAVFDQGSTGDLHYIAMEYVPGPTLRELLVARGRLNPREALDIIERVLAGLAAAHEAGIIHRDVKPENVLLGNGTSVKVADFGLARAAAGVSQTRGGLLIGTAAYLAPEQVASNASDQRTDVYAAGVMLFEMLTGVQPHTGESPLAVAYKHVNAVVPPPSSVNADLPAALDALVALGTSRDPELRPPDARHYLKAITEVRRGMPLPPPARRSPKDAVGTPPPGAMGQPRQSPGTGPVSPATGRVPVLAGPTGQLKPDSYPSGQPASGGYPGYPGRQGAGAGANHTMIVPAGEMARDLDGAGYGGPRGRRSRRYHEPWLHRWLFSRRILIVLAALLVAGAAWWLVEGQYVTVPAVAGLPLSGARQDLSSAGLQVIVGTARHSNSVPAGHVIGTDPASGARVSHGGRVVLIVSLGPVYVTMPSVTGESLDQARQTLSAAGLKAGPLSYAASATIPQGTVIATNPSAYQRWPKYKPVQLVVSAGPPVPNFVGQPITVAQAAAEAGGYRIQQVTLSNSSAPPGTVVRQLPAAGSPISSGGVVTLWVSPGPPEVSVPNVDGMDIRDAISELQGAGFHVAVNDVGPGNKVFNYSPQGQAPPGSTITITVGFSF